MRCTATGAANAVELHSQQRPACFRQDAGPSSCVLRHQSQQARIVRNSHVLAYGNLLWTLFVDLQRRLHIGLRRLYVGRCSDLGTFGRGDLGSLDAATSRVEKMHGVDTRIAFHCAPPLSVAGAATSVHLDVATLDAATLVHLDVAT